MSIRANAHRLWAQAGPTLWRSALFVVLGALGGWLMSHVPVPLPYLLGALATGALTVAFAPAALTQGYRFPDTLRLPFIACIGLLIGAQVHLETITDWRPFAALLVAVTLFTPAAHAINYHLMRRAGGYDRPTAYFGAAPGGLIEAMTLGEQAGANVAILTVQQFLRIVLVVTFVPLGMSLWVGHPVGSAAGMAQFTPTALSPVWLIALIGGAGVIIGRALRMPAPQMIGPMILAGALGSSGLLSLGLPVWLINFAQVMIGTSLGLRFNGLSASVLKRGIGIGLVSAGLMVTLGALLTLGLISLLPLAGDATFLSLAPGGVTEMALVALSISADPALVALAHVYRISLTVLFLGAVWPRLASRA